MDVGGGLMAAAQWTTVPREVVAAAQPDGTFLFSAPLLDGGSKVLTLRLTIDPNRKVTVLVTGEPGAVLTGFEAWSNI
jgi:hypothetical protein